MEALWLHIWKKSVLNDSVFPLIEIHLLVLAVCGDESRSEAKLQKVNFFI